MKSQYSKDLKEGDLLDAPFFVKVNTATKQADGATYRLNGELVDTTGSIPFVRFDVEESIVQKLGTGRIVGVRGSVKKSKYAPREVRVNEFYVVKEADIEASDYEVVAPIPLADMKKELFEIIATVQDPCCANLLHFAFPESSPNGGLNVPDSVQSVYSAFIDAPGASGHHHAYKHGLFQHTLDVTRAARALAKASPSALNVDVITTAALLHDIGKVLEYTPLPNLGGYGRTQKGNLFGHIVLGVLTVNNYIGVLRLTTGFDENIGDHILHCILSHHTKKEYGSPVTPMTLEALTLARADGHDAESFKLREAMDANTPGREAVKMGDHYFYVKPLDREDVSGLMDVKGGE